MARVTVEDCVLKVPNRFELVMMAAQRARDMSAGGKPTVDRDNDKNPVVALREIAEGTLELPVLKNSLIQGLQKHVEVDEPEEDDIDTTLTGQDLLLEAGASTVATNEDLSEISSSEDDLDSAEDTPDVPDDI